MCSTAWPSDWPNDFHLEAGHEYCHVPNYTAPRAHVDAFVSVNGGVECGGCEWFASSLAQLQSGGSHRVNVVWNNPPAMLDRTAACDGIVAINCKHIPRAQLRTAGYNYVRHFAALPSLKNARWFVPLDSPAVSSAALSLYTPARLSARLKRGAVRLAMRTHLPIWYRDHIWIAQREIPPMEMVMQPLFPGIELRWALSSGAPEGARNRKASGLLLAPDGKMLGFVKMASSDIARRILGHEGEILDQLSRIPAIADSVPRSVFFGEVDNIYVLAQTPLPGTPPPLALTAAHHAFLAGLQMPKTGRAADTATASTLRERLASLPTPPADLLNMCDRVMAELRQFDVPTTIVHGDFAPWNLRLHNGRIGAFDWEYAEPLGLPLIDEMHYRLQCGWLLENWLPEQGAQCLAEMSRQRRLGLSPSSIEAIAGAYLLDALARLLGEGYGEDDKIIIWHRQCWSN